MHTDQIAEYYSVRHFGKGGFTHALAEISMKDSQALWTFGQSYRIRKQLWKVDFK